MNSACRRTTKKVTKGGIHSKYLHRSDQIMTISFEILTLGYLSNADLSVLDEVSSLMPS